MNRALPAVLLLTTFLSKAAAADIATYQKPPQEIADAIQQALPPVISISPTKDYAVLMEAPAHPSIAELAEPMARLAGLPHR